MLTVTQLFAMANASSVQQTGWKGIVMTDLKGHELSEALCRELEPEDTLPEISAREARINSVGGILNYLSSKFVWTSSNAYPSPLGWCSGEIGSDHGPESADNDPIEWHPETELTASIEQAWRVVEEMKRRGWFLSIRIVPDKVFADFSKFPDRHLSSRPKTVGSTADDEPTAICRAALAALRHGKEAESS